MKTAEKLELKFDVLKMLSDGYESKEIIKTLEKQGFKANTIRQYIKALNNK